jgi:3-phenylpropionate/cinnamic acid dioxygenase small subunit
MFRTNRPTLTAVATLLAVTLIPLSSAQTKTVGDNASLAARVKHLEDLEEIRTVLTDYGRFLDARDFSSYSQLFAKDGEWFGGLGKVQGPAAIQGFMEKSIGTTNPGHNYHLLSNFEIEVHGDTASAWSRWAFVVAGPDKKPTIAQGGHYDDTLVREDGQWRFKRRKASTDLPSSGPVQTK